MAQSMPKPMPTAKNVEPKYRVKRWASAMRG